MSSIIQKSKSVFSSAGAKCANFYKRLKNDEGGIAAIEFALIAPVMVIFYFGLAEISLLISADRKVSQSSSLIGDLAAQDPEVTAEMMEDFINAALAVNNVDETAAQRLGIEMYSFEARSEDTDGDGVDERVVEQIGSAVFGPSYMDDGSAFDGETVDQRLLSEGTGVVVARVRYDYQSPYRYFVQDMSLRETFLLKPRRSATVEFNSGFGGTDVVRLSNMQCRLIGGGNNQRVDCQPAASAPGGGGGGGNGGGGNGGGGNPNR